MGAAAIDVGLHVDGDLVGYTLDDGSPIYAGRQTRVFLKDVRPDLRSRTLVPDEVFDSLSANSTQPCTVILCAHGHTASMKPRDFRYLEDCVYCLGKRVWPGFTDLETLHPDFVATHWIHEKNELDPGLLAPKSHQKVWLRCEQGHESKVTLATRFTAWSKGVFSCRRCQGLNRALRAEKTFRSEYPELALEWGPTNERKAYEVTPKSGLTVGWICVRGHEWREAVAARVVNGTGCPYCSGHRVLAGFNDLVTVSPKVAAQWHPDNELSPAEVTVGSNIRVLWLCAEGHEWEAQVNYRNRNGCPRCARTQVSLVERLLWARVAERIPGVGVDVVVDDALDQRNRPARCDAALPQCRAVLEYDGQYWHRDRLARDRAKTDALLRAGWSVIRVREDGLPLLDIDDAGLFQIQTPVWRTPTDEALAALYVLADRVVHILTTIQSSAAEQTNTKETK